MNIGREWGVLQEVPMSSLTAILAHSTVRTYRHKGELL